MERKQTWLGQRSACFMREGLCVPTCWMAISRVIALVCASPGAAMSTSRAAKKNTATLHQQHHRFIVIKLLASRHRHMWEGMPSHLTANNAEPTRVEIASVSRRACAHWNFHHWDDFLLVFNGGNTCPPDAYKTLTSSGDLRPSADATAVWHGPGVRDAHPLLLVNKVHTRSRSLCPMLVC